MGSLLYEPGRAEHMLCHARMETACVTLEVNM